MPLGKNRNARRHRVFNLLNAFANKLRVFSRSAAK